MTDHDEPFREFIGWWDSPNTQYALREASDYTKAKSAFYAAWALRAPEPGPAGYQGNYRQFPPAGPPPVTRIDQYAFQGASDVGVMPDHPEPGMPGYAERKHREQQRYVETQMMPVVDETNPGFPATEFTPTARDGRQEAADGQA